MKIISGKGHNGELEYIVRKSTWLLFFYIFKYMFLLLILFSISVLSLELKKHILDNDTIYLVYISGVLVWILMLYVFIKAIITFIKFFYGVEIITETKLYKLDIGIFRIENISITNISNIQEVKAVSLGFFKVLLGISDVHIVEQRDAEKIIHCIDNGKKVVDIISDFKNKLVVGENQ